MGMKNKKKPYHNNIYLLQYKMGNINITNNFETSIHRLKNKIKLIRHLLV